MEIADWPSQHLLSQLMARVSIGMPVYNGQALVGAAIESLLRQTFKDFELIISDNGSTDNTGEICRQYASRDARVRYYRREQNQGATWNFNQVFHLSKSQYFKWAAHDDLCAPQFIERCVEVLDRDPKVVLCYPKTVDIDEHGNHLEDYYDGFDLRSEKPEDRLLQCLIFSSRCNPVFGLIRAPVLATTPLMGNFMANDYIILAQLALRGQFYEIPERLFFHREHQNRATRACTGFSEHLIWFDPKNAGKLPIRWLRLLVEYLGSIRGAPLPWLGAARCYWIMMRWIRWHWPKLATETLAIIRHTAAKRQADVPRKASV
jgi:glycosyltransferase involved in cell wall biosynthesis